MSLAGLILGSNVAGLDHNQFRRVANTLLTVEASVNGLPLDALDLSCRDNDPDGGVDARVQWPLGPTHDVLVPGENILQYKSGKITKKQVGAEFAKSGVQQALRSGAQFIILAGHDCTPLSATALRNYLRGICVAQGLEPAKCTIFFGSQIARWVARHPSVLIMRDLRPNYPAFITVEAWTQSPDLRNPWKPDAPRTEIIQEICSFLRRQTDFSTLRIEGPAGVGKTRITLEGVRESGLADSIIYTPNAEDQNVTDLIARIVADRQVQATVVVDECDNNRQDFLKKYVDVCEGRLRIICVGPCDIVFQVAPLSSNVFVLPPLAESKVKEVLFATFGALPPERVEAVVRLSRGFVKLALFVAEHLSRSGEVSASELVKIRDIRQFLKRFVDSGARKALQVLSLFGRLGWEDELRDEAEAVANYFGIKFGDFQESVKSLRDDGVVVRRGRYLYVSPDLLAISAAAELWDQSGSELMGLAESLPRKSARHQLFTRLASMGTQPQVKRAVERSLGEEGLFKSLDDLNEMSRSEAFSILASAQPEAAVAVLERLVERAPRADLLAFNTGRRSVVWTIESLLRWPSLSLRAARSLRALAISESESFGNSATGIFCEYFQVHLSRSPIPLIERLDLIDELVDADDATSRLLAAKAAAASLRYHEFRFGGNVDELSGVPYPKEWRPRTSEELRDSRSAVIARIEQIAKGLDEAGVEARASLIRAPLTLIGEGLLDEAVGTLELVTPRSDKERRELLDSCSRLESAAKDQLTQGQFERLNVVAEQMFGDKYLDRIKRWVGPRLDMDFDMEGHAGYREADEKTRKLADEGFEKGISGEELAWLASPEAENVWEFALRLGEVDSKQQFLERIAGCSGDNVNALLLAGYLSGRATAEGQEFRDDFLDRLAPERPMLAFVCTWRGAASSRGVQRILGLVSDKIIDADFLVYLQFGGWTSALSVDEVSQIVIAMLTAGMHSMFHAAASIVINLLAKRPESLEALEQLVWKLVERRPEDNWSWYWGKLASRVVSRNPVRIVETIVGFFSSGDFVPIPGDETMKMLRQGTAQNPEAAWNIVGSAILKGDDIAPELVISLTKWYGELIPTEILIAWANNHLPRGPWVVSRIIRVQEAPLPERARALLLSFPGDSDIKVQLATNLQTGFSTGAISGRVGSDLGIIRRWAEDADPAIRLWARQLAKNVENRLKRFQTLEEETSL